MKYFLGVDIGNTKTLFALANEMGEVVHIHYCDGANYYEHGTAATIAILQGALNEIVRSAGISLQDIGFLYYGAAGADTPQDFEVLRKMFHDVTPSIPFDFENDGWIALKSGTIDGVGMVVTCGTGNTNFAKNSQGKQKRIGGLNDLLGDILGATNILLHACSAAMRSADGRDFPTILTRMIPKVLGISALEELMNFQFTAGHIKTVVQTFFQAAQMGDGKALEITWAFVKEVLSIVREFYLDLFREEQQFKLVLDGSVFKAKYPSLMTMIELALHQRYDNIEIIVPEWDPVIGALFYAFEYGGVQLTEALAKTIINTYLEESRS